MKALPAEALALWRARSLCATLTRREVAARYAGTALGWVWAYAQPLLTMAAYYLVFDVVFAMRVGEGASTRAVGTYLIAGMLPWMAFSDAVARAMNSLLESANVLQKNPLPPMLFPARAVLASSVVFAPLLLLLVLAYAPLHHFAPALLLLPVLVGVQIVLCLLWGGVLAILAAALRDVVQLVGFALSLGIFLSPVLFPTHLFPEAWRWALWLNPMTAWINSYQALLLHGAWPSVDNAIAMVLWLSAGAALLQVLLSRSREQLIDWL